MDVVDRGVLAGDCFTLTAGGIGELWGLVAEERLTLHERASLCRVLDELQRARASASSQP